jgi:hypothetical protein
MPLKVFLRNISWDRKKPHIFTLRKSLFDDSRLSKKSITYSLSLQSSKYVVQVRRAINCLDNVCLQKSLPPHMKLIGLQEWNTLFYKSQFLCNLYMMCPKVNLFQIITKNRNTEFS